MWYHLFFKIASKNSIKFNLKISNKNTFHKNVNSQINKNEEGRPKQERRRKMKERKKEEEEEKKKKEQKIEHRR